MKRSSTYRMLVLALLVLLLAPAVRAHQQDITEKEKSLIQEIQDLRSENHLIPALRKMNEIIDHPDAYSQEALARAFFERGVLYRGEDSPEFARKSFASALPLFKQLGSIPDIQATHLELGMISNNAGQDELALSHFERALKLNASEQASPKIAELQLMIGTLHLKLDEQEKARVALEAALPQFEQFNIQGSWNECVMQLLDLHQYQQTYNMGRNLAYDAFQRNHQAERWKDAQQFSTRLADFNAFTQRIPQAIRAQEKAVELAVMEEMPDAWKAYLRLGELYSQSERRKEADQAFEEAMNRAYIGNDLYSQRVVSRSLANHYDRFGEDKKAFEMLSFSDSLQMLLIARAERQHQQPVQTLGNDDGATLQYPSTYEPWYRQTGYLIFSAISALLGIFGLFILKRRHKRQVQLLRWKLFKRTREMRSAQEDLTSYIHRSSMDLRNPLVSIQGMLRMLRTEEHSLNTRRCLRTIESSAEQMDKILINLSKALEYQKRDVRVERVDFRKLRSDLQADYIQQPGGVELIWEFQENAPFYSDPRLIKVILVNTMRNSIQFRSGTDQDFCKISFITTEKGASLSIQDNGVGISDKIRENIFGMFVKGSAQSEGTGLGLYLVRLACERIHGKLELTTTVSEGSTLTFTLPNLVGSENRGELSQESDVVLEEGA